MYNLSEIFPEINKKFISELYEKIPEKVITGQGRKITPLLTRIYKSFREDLLSAQAGKTPPKWLTAKLIRNNLTEVMYSGDTLKVRLQVWVALKNAVSTHLMQISPARNKTGEFNRFVMSVLDMVMFNLADSGQAEDKESRKDKELIRKLKIVKNDLQVQLNLMYQFIKSSPVGLAGCDDELKVKFWNPMAVRMTGYEQSFIIDKSFDKILSARSREVFRKRIPSYEHSRVRRLKLNIKTKTGGNFHSLISLNRISSGESVSIRYVISFTDLSREEIMQIQVRKIDQLSALARLADAIMHDIRNPIGALALNIDVLTQILEETGWQSSRIDKVVEKINRQIGELTRNLNQYVGYSGITELKMEPFDLGTIIDELILDTRVQVATGSVRLEYKRSRKELKAYGDWRQLVRAFRNLLANAQEAVGKKGRISVVTRMRNGNIHVSVTDNGPGIPAENMHSIYQPYFTTKQNGTGLGLFIVREIVRGHKGKIYCTSKPEFGTRFTVSLPTIQKIKMAKGYSETGVEHNEPA